MTRGPRLIGAVLTGLLLSSALASCGVPVDDQPQQIDVPSLDSLGSLESLSSGQF